MSSGKVKSMLGDTPIEPFGYQHWSGKVPTPDVHEPFFVPQTIMDGWQCHCTCGRWRGFASFYDYNTKDDLLGALRTEHEAHASTASGADCGA